MTAHLACVRGYLEPRHTAVGVIGVISQAQVGSKCTRIFIPGWLLSPHGLWGARTGIYVEPPFFAGPHPFSMLAVLRPKGHAQVRQAPPCALFCMRPLWRELLSMGGCGHVCGVHVCVHGERVCV